MAYSSVHSNDLLEGQCSLREGSHIREYQASSSWSLGNVSWSCDGVCSSEQNHPQDRLGRVVCCWSWLEILLPNFLIYCSPETRNRTWCPCHSVLSMARRLYERLSPRIHSRLQRAQRAHLKVQCSRRIPQVTCPSQPPLHPLTDTFLVTSMPKLRVLSMKVESWDTRSVSPSEQSWISPTSS